MIINWCLNGACYRARPFFSDAAVLYLASKSPRRRQLLEQAGIRFGIIDVDVPEMRLAGESPIEYVSRVAREKADAGLLALSGVAGAVVLGADTEVVIDDEVFGKPFDAADAARMLRRLAGRTHQVPSVVWCADAGREERAVSITDVTFTALSDEQIARYLATDEWQGKAGAYAIQCRAETFVAHLSGSYSGVMGLPLCETVALVQRFGIVAES